MNTSPLLSRRKTALVVIDIQERLLPAISNNEEVVRNSVLLINGARILGVPIIITEQYPKGLGPTVSAIAEAADKIQAIEKITFSCAGEDNFLQALDAANADTVVLCGIETHVCVLQTALDLYQRGIRVQVAADAVGSRSPANRESAMAEMRQAGIVPTAAESVLFKLLRVAGTPEFKQVAKLVR